MCLVFLYKFMAGRTFERHMCPISLSALTVAALAVGSGLGVAVFFRRAHHAATVSADGGAEPVSVHSTPWTRLYQYAVDPAGGSRGRRLYSDGVWRSVIQRHPCVIQREHTGFLCPTHQALFRPSIDPLSSLWPRIQDGLRLFGVAPQKLLSITAFRLGMEHHSQFTAQLSPKSFGALLGDAACSIHFWPGRGLNTGLKLAVSLARCLASRWRGIAE